MLSKGNKQKIGLVQGLMNEPRLLILDEPISGLDPLVQQTVHDLLFEASRDGRTVFLSHILSEVERVADRVGVLRCGRLVAVEDVDALKHKALRRVTASFAPGPLRRVLPRPGCDGRGAARSGPAVEPRRADRRAGQSSGPASRSSTGKSANATSSRSS